MANYLLTLNDFPEFIGSLSLPIFNPKKTSLSLKADDLIKQFKNTRHNLVIENEAVLQVCLIILCSKILLLKPKIIVNSDGEQWSQLQLECENITALNALKTKKLLNAGEKLGFYHSKPFNTLSSHQFCVDADYIADAEVGFTASQLSNTTAKLSVSGGSNSDSAFYALLISRVNFISIAEHLITDSVFSVQIQQFFQQFITPVDLKILQSNIKNTLNKTADSIDTLHIMDKQVLLPVFDGDNDYISITPIINPTVLSASGKEWFYVKGQSTRFMNIPLGGANPSNAGTAVGENSGQNSRFQQTFPQIKLSQVQRIITALNYKNLLWSKQRKQKNSDKLTMALDSEVIPNQNKKKLLRSVISYSINDLSNKIHSIHYFLSQLDEIEYDKTMARLSSKYRALFIKDADKDSLKQAHQYLLSTLKNNLKDKGQDELDKTISDETNRQFAIQQRNGGF